MPQATRDIQRRIKSVKNTKKITKAMELVAAAKMRKAVAKVLATRSYADLAWNTVLHLVKKLDTSRHPFFRESKEVRNVLIVLISTNRGLCGSFNLQLVQKVVDSIKLHHPDTRVTDVITFGSKGRNEARRHHLNIMADFAKEDITQSSTIINPITHMVVKDFIARKYDKVFVAYTDFASSLQQQPHVRQLLPIVPEIDERLGYITHQKEKEIVNINVENFSDFLFEPSRKEILNSFLPRLVEIQIFQAVLESEASEHSARMLAMRNASDAAGDMIDELTLAYNQARQAGITAEIAEISAGTAALQ
ncbi:MAG: ATP synthase F1 subunit gamma [Candidatus Komeilibacteria bacterium CG11_big_fil_rev_8_21_14_0_20_36_20]|uniref:ATP synthase gamma chain n=1 Tax=Candidatus Komeilibacteria bacterium CG11_big_fil_rev_8_21_14_0_20_36_20 TaxID=1974477 RepID=A0A2H0NDY4_9BACT|nr:MAG: ATP synthase F1 subunit gamma [Candidatus Komeilibacteria bacterium CG11_big_fil_rev_8_21_14_0_20_36_20]PIR81230.1 MAG: ATP synthase F1 subunit gamma [Candidatus Komeilibacteria bacterium CG10_big_fil_rev_8_21_14_0_10_36_65]PJC55194.1 MAG: ATP synthase F1 subunit gamma [Candidatus Komeilibacteria bacterium CG_4_9_14_0_2_um_filter_36_13]